MPNYLVVRAMAPTGIFRPSPLTLGTVEIRKPESDTASELKALEESKTHYQVSASLDGIAMRICTIVDASSIEEADKFAFEKFDEVQDILQHTTMAAGLVRFQLTECGYFKDLESGKLQARRFVTQPDSHSTFPVFHVVEHPFPPIDHSQLFFAIQESELKKGLLRSYYWSRKARWEFDKQLRLLFRWFAMEAIWMVSQEDDISPRILWCMGFPTGAGASIVDRHLVKNLNSDPRYRHWKKRLEDAFLAIKEFRNSTVHNGFRPVDLSNDKLSEYDHIAKLACSRVQGFAYAGIQSDLCTSRELLEYAPLIFEKQTNPKTVHDTLIYLLANPTA